MAHDQLMQAKNLIEAGRYPEARRLLLTIDHPKAREWLLKLDDVEGRVNAPTAPKPPYSEQTVISARPHPTAQVPEYATPYSATQQPHYPMPYEPVQAVPEKSINVLSIPLALIGGLVGAALGGAIWAAIAYFTNYEVGYVALGIGFLSGALAVLFTGGRRGIPIGIIAILTALVGIVAGKYAAIYFIGIKQASEQMGADMTRQAMEMLPPLDPETISLVIEDMQASLAPLDALFVILAAFAAFRIAGMRNSSPAAAPKPKRA